MGKQRRRYLAGWLNLLAASLASTTALSQPTQIQTDGTLGPKLSLSGNDVSILPEFGQIRGDNLFHSFETFDIGAGERATFSGPDRLQNVIARVTGNDPSTIRGTLASTVGQADLWFVNPNGIVFADGARLAVPAGFHLTTTDSLIFADGTTFSAVDPDGSTLSIAAPERFGFLNPQTAPISVSDAIVEVAAGQRLTLVAGDVDIRDASLAAPAGKLELQVNSLEIGRFGAITSQSSDRANAGRIEIDAERLTIDGGESTDPSILVVAERFTGIAADAQTESQGNAGRIRLDVGELQIRDGGIVSTRTFGAGAGGDIEIASKNLQIDGFDLFRFTGISSGAGRLGRGDAGDIRIETGQLSIERNGSIASNTLGPGDAGDIRIRADAIFIQDGFYGISANSEFEIGNLVEATDRAQAFGNAGSIVIETDSLRLIDAAVTTDTSTNGLSGQIVVDADELSIAGGSIRSGTNFLSEGLNSTGQAGSIEIIADRVDIIAGGAITTSSLGEGQAGDIEVTAGSLIVDGTGTADGGLFAPSTGITSNFSGFYGAGRAGSVRVSAQDIDIRNGGIVASNNTGAGIAGDVIVNARSIAVTDATIATTGANNAGGRISISAKRAIRVDQGEITTSGVLPQAGASLVAIRAPFIEILNNSRVVSLAGDSLGPVDTAVSTGAAEVDGIVTVISPDSEIAASSTVTINGLESEVGSNLQLSRAIPSAANPLSSPCRRAATDQISSFRTQKAMGLRNPIATLGANGSTPKASQQRNNC